MSLSKKRRANETTFFPVLYEHSTLLKSYTGGNFFPLTLEWTQDLYGTQFVRRIFSFSFNSYSRDKHFSGIGLLPFATPNKFSVLNSEATDPYTPRLLASNKFFVKVVRKYRKKFGSTEVSAKDTWNSLERFEATKSDDSIVIFTGGPVLSMAWIPVPDDHMSQLLAVCCRNDLSDDILLNNTQPTKCLIQIWNFNKLKNGYVRHCQLPNLLYSVAYDHGPVIQMEFCPSGGFTEDRLGLLAVSSCDGHVDILSLPKNFTCDNSTIQSLVFAIQPSLTLTCERDQPLGVLMTKLAWSQVCTPRPPSLNCVQLRLTLNISQSLGHTKLAGGFANGLVAIWNLKNLETPHTCREVDGVPTVLPTDLFYAGNKTIRRTIEFRAVFFFLLKNRPFFSVLEFHHDERNEARWLIAGSHDRKVKFFDTHNVHVEISTVLAHSRVVAGTWPMHWSTFLLGMDNAYSISKSLPPSLLSVSMEHFKFPSPFSAEVSGIAVKQPLDIGCRSASFYSCVGSTCDISFNNWLNTYVFVTSYGDIHVGYAGQMVSGFCETRRHRSILGYTDCVDANRSIAGEDKESEEPPQNSLCSPADGIIFCDFFNVSV